MLPKTEKPGLTSLELTFIKLCNATKYRIIEYLSNPTSMENRVTQCKHGLPFKHYKCQILSGQKWRTQMTSLQLLH